MSSPSPPPGKSKGEICQRRRFVRPSEKVHSDSDSSRHKPKSKGACLASPPSTHFESDVFDDFFHFLLRLPPRGGRVSLLLVLGLEQRRDSAALVAMKGHGAPANALILPFTAQSSSAELPEIMARKVDLDVTMTCTVGTFAATFHAMILASSEHHVCHCQILQKLYIPCEGLSLVRWIVEGSDCAVAFCGHEPYDGEERGADGPRGLPRFGVVAGDGEAYLLVRLEPAVRL